MTYWNWWTTTVLTFVGFGVAAHFGAYEFILANDWTRISFIILGIFAASNFYVGWCTYRVKQGMVFPVERYGPAWFTSDALLTLGMVGTLIGFLTVLSTAFGDIDVNNPESLKLVIGTLATGMGTALLTTLTGLVTSLVLKTQLVNLEEGNAKNAEVSQ